MYIDDQASCPAQQVILRGDWNGWKDIAMMREQGRTWFVVTPVSNGYHEFSFVCDGNVMTSPRHPTTQDNKVNWRIVMGPANYDELVKQRNAKRNNKRPFFMKWLLHFLVRLGIVTDVGNLGGEDDTLDAATAMEMHAERVHHWTNVFSKQKNLVLPSTATHKPKLRSMGSWLTELGVVGFVIVGVLTYFICTSLYSVVFGK